jgi:hypothetical protein
MSYCQVMAVTCRNKSYHFGLLNGFEYWHRNVHNFKRNGKTIDASGKTIFAQYVEQVYATVT